MEDSWIVFKEKALGGEAGMVSLRLVGAKSEPRTQRHFPRWGK